MKKLLFLILLFLLQHTVYGQVTDEIQAETLTNQSLLEPVVDTVPDINIFDDEEPLNITLKYDITSFIKTKSKGEYLDAVLQIHYDENQTITKNIRLKARGNFRRGQCIFPPIYLNFKTDPWENSDMEGIKKLKLVTHCSSSKSNEVYLMKEYLAYKIYNVLTDYSFRVRLCHINYIDEGKKGKNYHRYGFIIEPEELLAKRNESIIVEPTIIRKDHVINVDADRVALFQYMIGNTDWRIKAGHNTKYIKSLNQFTTRVIPVPYDFDFSGFVNTNYSTPQAWTSIKKVTEREYLGYCREIDDDYLSNITFFVNNMENVFQEIEDFKYLESKDKKTLTKYIQAFYKELNKPERFLVTLKNECRSNF